MMRPSRGVSPDLPEQPALLSSTLAASSDNPAQLSFMNLIRISVVASVRCFRVGLQGEPGMLGIVAKNPITFRTRHDIQVVQVITVSCADGMIAPGHQDHIAVVHANRFVEITLIGVHTLESKSLRGL